MASIAAAPAGLFARRAAFNGLTVRCATFPSRHRPAPLISNFSTRTSSDRAVKYLLPLHVGPAPSRAPSPRLASRPSQLSRRMTSGRPRRLTPRSTWRSPRWSPAASSSRMWSPPSTRRLRGRAAGWAVPPSAPPRAWRPAVAWAVSPARRPLPAPCAAAWAWACP